MHNIQNDLQKLREELILLHARLNLMTGVLDRLPIGIILLNDSGQLVEMNEPAKHLLSKRDGLLIQNHRLQARLPKESAAIDALIAKTTMTVEGESASQGHSFLVHRCSGKRPYELLIGPLHKQPDDLGSHRCLVCIFICDPELDCDSLGERLTQLYELTKAETDITLLLIRGFDSKSICQRLDIHRETVKTHLKHIFRKTGTHRQSEVVSTILQGSALFTRKT